MNYKEFIDKFNKIDEILKTLIKNKKPQISLMTVFENTLPEEQRQTFIKIRQHRNEYVHSYTFTQKPNDAWIKFLDDLYIYIKDNQKEIKAKMYHEIELFIK